MIGHTARREEEHRRGIFTRRAIGLGLGQLGLFGYLGHRLWSIQQQEGEKYTLLAEENRLSARLMSSPRGRVLDRQGRVVAGNKLNWRALLVPEQTQDVAATLATFSKIVPLTEQDNARVERELRRRRRFVPLVLREFLSWEEMARLEVNAPDLPGILTDVGHTRIYPEGPEMVHLVGYVAPPAERDMDGDPVLALPGMRVGRQGIERFHEKVLRGRAGAVQLEVNVVGRVIRELDRREPLPGEDIQISVDTELHKKLRAKAKEGTTICVLDAKNGEIVSLVSQPSFDPNVFTSGVSAAQWKAWTATRSTPLINKATNGLYAPGSTFKMMVALAGLEAKVIGPHDRISCHGHLDFGGNRFHCHNRRGHGAVDMRVALKASCDVYFYQLAMRCGIDRIAAMANRFGLGVDLEIDLPGTRRGLVPTKAWRQAQGKPWNLGDNIIHGIGQGWYQITPIALATMSARLATGRAVQPHLTRAIGGKPVPGRRPEDFPSLNIPERDLQLMRSAMYGICNEGGGTAPLGRLPAGYGAMAGKTGSVQVRRVTRAQRERGYSAERVPREWRPHALFVCFAPYNDPQYAISVVIEHGIAGGKYAAPAARDAMITVMNHFRVLAPAGPRVAESRAG